MGRTLLAVALAAALTASCAGHDPGPEAPPPAPAIPAPSIPAGENPSRWADAIAASVASRPALADPVVFVGSSSIRRWDTLAEDMAPIPVVNHGFGGSRIFDAVHWLETLLEGITPRALVVFSGSNDIAGDSPRDPAWIVERFDELVARMRALGHDVPLVYIAISPTPARGRHLALVLETNRLIAARCAADPALHFVDTAAGLLDADGRPDPRWFVGDGLHLNGDGYAAWTAAIRPALEGALAGR